MKISHAMYPTNRNLIFFPNTDCPDELRNALESQNWRVFIAQTLRQARDLIAKHPFYVGLCLINQNNDNKRLEQIKRLFNYSNQIKWVMGVPEDFIDNIARPRQENNLIFQYCHDYVTFPVCMEQMLYVLGHTHGMAQLTSCENQVGPDFFIKSHILGESSIMQNIYKQIEKIAKEEGSVLIEGESSMDKKLIADAIHNYSQRSDKPLITIKCGDTSKEMIQAELFGYEQGAFPGAHEQKTGRIELAQGGTLFLDEVCALSKELQSHLLRFFEERAITRIGGTEKIAIDVRIIAATRLDLDAAVREGRFRKDLYYRLRELELNLGSCAALA